MNPLTWTFQFIFGCHHSHVSRVFTIKQKTYKVCFDCGEEFVSSGTHVRQRDTVSLMTSTNQRIG